MLVTLTLKVQAFIKDDDENGLAAITAIAKDLGETAFGQVALVSNRPPTITAELDDDENGKRDVGLFNMSSHEEDYSHG